LAGFRPVVNNLHGEELYKAIREQIHKFLLGVAPNLDFQVCSGVVRTISPYACLLIAWVRLVGEQSEEDLMRLL
jgi:hypothetical protein